MYRLIMDDIALSIRLQWHLSVFAHEVETTHCYFMSWCESLEWTTNDLPFCQSTHHAAALAVHTKFEQILYCIWRKYECKQWIECKQWMNAMKHWIMNEWNEKTIGHDETKWCQFGVDPTGDWVCVDGWFLLVLWPWKYMSSVYNKTFNVRSCWIWFRIFLVVPMIWSVLVLSFPIRARSVSQMTVSRFQFPIRNPYCMRSIFDWSLSW